MARLSIDKMSLKQLEALESEIAAAKGKAAEERKAEIKGKIEALLASSDLTIADLYPALAKGKYRSKSSPKFRNPDDPAQTWTGRGRKPFWLVARLKKGQKLESFAI